MWVNNKSVEKAALRASKANNKFCSIKYQNLYFSYINGRGGASGKILQIWLDDKTMDEKGARNGANNSVGVCGGGVSSGESIENLRGNDVLSQNLGDCRGGIGQNLGGESGVYHINGVNDDVMGYGTNRNLADYGFDVCYCNDSDDNKINTKGENSPNNGGVAFSKSGANNKEKGVKNGVREAEEIEGYKREGGGDEGLKYGIRAFACVGGFDAEYAKMGGSDASSGGDCRNKKKTSQNSARVGEAAERERCEIKSKEKGARDGARIRADKSADDAGYGGGGFDDGGYILAGYSKNDTGRE